MQTEARAPFPCSYVADMDERKQSHKEKPRGPPGLVFYGILEPSRGRVKMPLQWLSLVQLKCKTYVTNDPTA